MRALEDEEIECLKSDLVLIYKVEHEDDVDGFFVKFPFKVAEDVVWKYWEEIKCTHSTLDRVMQELNSEISKQNNEINATKMFWKRHELDFATLIM